MAARESPQMIEEERERAESHSSSGGAHEVVQRPWWRKMFGRRISANRPSANFARTEF